MRADLRISVKDDRRNKNLKILLFRTRFGARQFRARMNGAPWAVGVFDAAVRGG